MCTYDVFISYRRSDGSEIASLLAEYLRAKGLRVFFDKNEIKDSQDFKDRIENSLRQAPNYLLIATTAAFQFYTDQEDWVKREMEIPSNLLEHVARRIGEGVRSSFPAVTSVRVKVSKLNPPLGGQMESVSVEVAL